MAPRVHDHALQASEVPQTVDFLTPVLISAFVAWIAQLDERLGKKHDEKLAQLLRALKGLRDRNSRVYVRVADRLRRLGQSRRGVRAIAACAASDEQDATEVIRWALLPDGEKRENARKEVRKRIRRIADRNGYVGDEGKELADTLLDSSSGDNV